MATPPEFLSDPLVRAAIAGHGYTEARLPWHVTGFQPGRQVDLGMRGGLPSVHIDDDRVMMRWFTPEQAVGYSVTVRNGEISRRVHIESCNLPESVVVCAEGRVLAELVDLPGAWEMDVLSAWSEDDTGITDRSTMIEVEPYRPAFAGDMEPAILHALTQMGLSRRRPILDANQGDDSRTAFLTTRRSYIGITANGVSVCYEVALDGRERIDKIYLSGALPESLLASCVGRVVGDIVRIPKLEARTITATALSALEDMTILTITTS